MAANILKLLNDYVSTHGVKEAHQKASCLLTSISGESTGQPSRENIIKAKAASDMLWYLFEDKDIDFEYETFMKQWLSK